MLSLYTKLHLNVAKMDDKCLSSDKLVYKRKGLFILNSVHDYHALSKMLNLNTCIVY